MRPSKIASSGSKPDKKLDSKLLQYIWQLILPYKKNIFLAVIILLIGKGIASILPLGIKYGIDIIQNTEPDIKIDFAGLVEVANVTLTDIGIFLIIVLLIQFGTTFLQISVTNIVGQNIMRDLRSKIFAHTIKLSLTFFDRSKTGQLITRIVHDVQTLNELFVTGIPTIFGDSFLIISILVISFLLDVKLAFVTLCSLPLLYLGMRIFKKYARKSFLQIRVYLAEMNAFVRASIDGIKIIQVFNKQNKMNRMFHHINKKYFLEYLRTVKIFAYYFPGVESFSIISRVLLLIFGGYWVSTGQSSLANVIAFLLYSPMFFRPMRELSEQYNALQSAMASAEKIYALLETDSFIEEDENPINIDTQDFRGEIEFKNVSFSYQEGNEILHNISFKINSGEKVAIVGVTGSGKSTIISLINRLYDIDQGEILIDGVNIKKLSKNSLRKMISSVLQEVFIFSDTIKENIRLLDESISDEMVHEAAQHVRAESFINRLSQGYETELGEKGVGLSFGEKQLLAFARALIHKSKIVVFDEATSNIDLKTEAIIQKNIKQLIQEHSAIIIAHRLSTIREVDKIIVLHKGKIIEMGNHDELMRQQGYYEKLYHLQFQKEVSHST